jgi:hypothetical protein
VINVDALYQVREDSFCVEEVSIRLFVKIINANDDCDCAFKAQANIENSIAIK